MPSANSMFKRGFIPIFWKIRFRDSGWVVKTTQRASLGGLACINSLASAQTSHVISVFDL